LKIAIIGGGITGLSAAYDLLESGHEVSIFEAAGFTGGLASGFLDDGWEWPLEYYYHHLFTSDKYIIRLADELGISDKLYFPRPITSVVFQGGVVPFDSPKAWLTFPGFNILDVVRFGLISAYLRFTNPWVSLEQVTADWWLRRWYGDKIYETVWRPLLIGKFGPHYDKANMAWMWARLKVRSPRLGYFKGGFQSFVEALSNAVDQRGGELNLNSPVISINPTSDNQLSIKLSDHEVAFDRCLVTSSPSRLLRLAPDISGVYKQKLVELKSMGAVVLILALKKQLLPKAYWLNLPAASTDKIHNDYPFLALVEHTNYIDKVHYGGDHLVYCGDYTVPDHIYFDMDKEGIEELFLSVLDRFNPSFSPDWVRKSWLFRTRYAQPVPEVNHSKRIPDIETPVKNLYYASMSQVYPWDRGTNYAVDIGRRAARIMSSG
jgi:protoporphyrinogen oxidase